MKALIHGLLASLLLLGCSPSAQHESDGSVQNVAVNEFSALVQQTPDLVIVDVRTPEEISLGKIASALEIDFSQPDFEDRIAELSKDKPVLVYCAAGGRSSRAAEMMRADGFTKVFNLKGGMNAWTAAGLPVAK